jgi:hypothetical protein
MMAKAPKTTKAPKAASSKAKPKAARKPAAPKKAKKEEPAPEPVFHNETRLFFGDDAGRQTIEEAFPLIDAVLALGNVQITSASAREGKIDIHVVKPDHPQPYTQFPGVILTVDFDDSSVMFDHFTIGFISPELIDDAATTLLSSLIGPAGDRQADWFQRAEAIVDELFDRHARPLGAVIAAAQASA